MIVAVKNEFGAFFRQYATKRGGVGETSHVPARRA